MEESTIAVPTLADYVVQLQVLRAWEEEMAKPRHADPRRLLRYGFKTYAQNDEDGIIQEIFRRIGATARTFVEFGVESGVECNSAKLLVEGWRGLWIEARSDHGNVIRRRFAPFLDRRKLTLLESLVNAENIDALLAEGGMAGEIDLLSIDIDYNDYWVWKAVTAVRPARGGHRIQCKPAAAAVADRALRPAGAAGTAPISTAQAWKRWSGWGLKKATASSAARSPG